MSEVPVNSQTGSHAVLTIINDQTDMETVMDELTGAKAMLDTLRAFNHEFLNKLHVILGYLQTGQTEEATSSPASRSGRQPTASAYQRSAPWSSER